MSRISSVGSGCGKASAQSSDRERILAPAADSTASKDRDGNLGPAANGDLGPAVIASPTASLNPEPQTLNPLTSCTRCLGALLPTHQIRKAGAGNVLHGDVMHAVVPADGVDRDDVRHALKQRRPGPHARNRFSKTVSSSDNSGRRILSATVRPRGSSFALSTIPMPPRPMMPRILYGPNSAG